MTPWAVIETTILMGLLVLAGGVWAILYCLGRSRARKDLLWAAVASYAMALAIAIAIAVDTPLDLKWKLLIIVSALAYAGIPPMTLRYLERLHSEESHS